MRSARKLKRRNGKKITPYNIVKYVDEMKKKADDGKLEVITPHMVECIPVCGSGKTYIDIETDGIVGYIQDCTEKMDKIIEEFGSALHTIVADRSEDIDESAIVFMGDGTCRMRSYDELSPEMKRRVNSNCSDAMVSAFRMQKDLAKQKEFGELLPGLDGFMTQGNTNFNTEPPLSPEKGQDISNHKSLADRFREEVGIGGLTFEEDIIDIPNPDQIEYSGNEPKIRRKVEKAESKYALEV